MKRLEGWAKTPLDHSQILDVAEITGQIQIAISRRDASGEAYVVARSIWIFINIKNKWALIIRSMFQKTGEISYPTGQKT